MDLYPRTRTLITNDKRRLLLTGLCGAILGTKEGWRKRPNFGGGLCQAHMLHMQDQATLTTFIKAKIDKTHVDHKCRM